ncbi:nesprin-4 isoform X2, partial [Sigmodon hispidus]
ELDIAACTIHPLPGEETSRSEQAQASLGPPEHVTGDLKDTEPATSPLREPLAASQEHGDGGKC